MNDEQPEQWAVELLEAVHDASDIGTACGMVDCPQCAKAALTIQRAFTERTAYLAHLSSPAKPSHNRTRPMQSERYIVCWRKTPAMGSVLDWDHYVAFDLDEAKQAVANIKKQGVIQYYTAPLGENLADLSCDFGGSTNAN